MDKERLRVRFDAKLLEKLAGISGREVNEMNKLRSTQPRMVDGIENILKNLTTKLEAIHTFVIEFNANADHPIVVDIDI